MGSQKNAMTGKGLRRTVSSEPHKYFRSDS